MHAKESLYSSTTTNNNPNIIRKHETLPIILSTEIPLYIPLIGGYYKGIESPKSQNSARTDKATQLRRHVRQRVDNQSVCSQSNDQTSTLKFQHF